MKAMVVRCEAVNPKVNAITYSFYERALDQARDAEAKYMKTDGRLRPLEGIPIAIKDFHPIKDEITTFGSRLYKDCRPDNTAPTVERLFDAGAIMHIRTTTPEFAHSSVTKSPLLGDHPQSVEPGLHRGWFIRRIGRRRCRRNDHGRRWNGRWRFDTYPVLRVRHSRI